MDLQTFRKKVPQTIHTRVHRPSKKESANLLKSGSTDLPKKGPTDLLKMRSADLPAKESAVDLPLESTDLTKTESANRV